MCGLAADLRGPIPEAVKRVIDRRGTRSKQVGPIYHRRLPIVGLDAANDQPVTAGRWTIGFVGEILDFRDYNPEYECDAQLVADLWKEKGSKCLTDRDGFWHVAAYDDVTGHLHLLCDYLSQKPLYYRTDFGACASEPVACAQFAPTGFDEIYMSAVAKWGYCPEPWRTPFLNVRRVLPGEHVVLDIDGVVLQEIVDPLIPEKFDLKYEIASAIRRRVRSSDVPIACLLSGGLDSSIVYTLASTWGDIRPYYVYGEEPDEDEIRLVEKVAAGRSVQGVSWSNVGDLDALGMMQEPLDLGSLVPQCALASAVKEVVCLTGDGADEMFGGYKRAYRYDSQHSDIFHELVCWHLPRLDRVMMNSMIEVRSPFLARRVVQSALALPRDMRTGKKVLRELFFSILPEEVIYQKKKPLKMKNVGEERSVKLVNMFRRMCS